MADSTTKYLSYAGLETLVKQIKKYYAEATTSDRVAYAKKADVLATARTISLAGDASGSVSFDGSGDVSIAVGIADATSTTHGLMSAEDKAAFDKLAKINEVDTNEVADTNGAKLTFADGKLGLSLPSYALKSDIVAVFKFKGTVADVDSLPSTATEGDVYHVTDKHAEYVYVKVDGATAATWEELGSIMDLSAYATIAKIEDGTIVAGKAKQLTNSLAIKLSDTVTKTFDGSSAVSVDLSNIALDDNVAHRIKDTGTPEGTSAASGMILKGSAKGDLESTSVSASKLSNGECKAGNTSFVEGGVVYTYVEDKIAGLDKADSAVAGKYVSAVSEADGIITVTRADVASSITADGIAPVSGKAVATYITSEINKLDVADTEVEGSFVSAVNEVDGKIQVLRVAASTTVTTADRLAGVAIPVTGEAVVKYLEEQVVSVSDDDIADLFK